MPYKENRKECPVCGEVFVDDNSNVCENCAGLMEYGILFIGVDVEKSNQQNRPCRTGHVRLIPEFSPEFGQATNDFHPNFLQTIFANRFCFLDWKYGKRLKIFENPLLIN